MSEYAANLLLMESAGHIELADPLEVTQRMPVAVRRFRQSEAKTMRSDPATTITGIYRTLPGFLRSQAE